LYAGTVNIVVVTRVGLFRCRVMWGIAGGLSEERPTSLSVPGGSLAIPAVLEKGICSLMPVAIPQGAPKKSIARDGV
jgi:hypothetical protein